MATHCSILAWEIPRTEEPGELQSMGSQKSQTLLSDQTTTTMAKSWASLWNFLSTVRECREVGILSPPVLTSDSQK